jgi:hypothetical protein
MSICAVGSCEQPATTGHREFRGSPENLDLMVCNAHIWARAHTCYKCDKKVFGRATHCYKSYPYPKGWVLAYFGITESQPPYGTLEGGMTGTPGLISEKMFCPECRGEAEKALEKILGSNG